MLALYQKGITGRFATSVPFNVKKGVNKAHGL